MSAQASLWLLPPPAVHDRFARLILALSQRFGTPSFDPHVTLAGMPYAREQQAVDWALAVAAALAPLPIRLTDVGYTDRYFRCLYVHAERSPALLAAHKVARDRSGAAPEANYSPHLSLVYGDLATTCKEEIIDEIGWRFDSTFVAEHIALCLPAGPPSGWRVIGPFPLTGK